MLLSRGRGIPRLTTAGPSPEWQGEANPHVVVNAFAGVARKQ